MTYLLATANYRTALNNAHWWKPVIRDGANQYNSCTHL